MKIKIFILTIFMIVAFTSCDRIIALTGDELLEIVNDVGEEYDLIFEPDSFGTTEGAVLIFYYPQMPKYYYVIDDNINSYTEIYVENFTKLSGYSNTQLFLTANKKLSVIAYVDNDIYTITEDGLLSLNELNITVPFGNIVERNPDNEELRYIILTPHWPTFGTYPWDKWQGDIAELYSNVANNFSTILQEASRHLDLYEIA